MSRATLRDAVQIVSGAYLDAASGVSGGGLAEIIQAGEHTQAALLGRGIPDEQVAVVCAGLSVCLAGSLFAALNPSGSGPYLPGDVAVHTGQDCLLNAALTGSGDASLARLNGYMKSLQDPRSASKLPVLSVAEDVALSVKRGGSVDVWSMTASWLRMVSVRGYGEL